MVALYNPASTRRRQPLAGARGILLDHRPGTTPVAVVTDAYRGGGRCVLTDLDRILDEAIGMTSTVLVGSSRSFAYEGFPSRHLRPRRARRRRETRLPAVLGPVDLRLRAIGFEQPIGPAKSAVPQISPSDNAASTPCSSSVRQPLSQRPMEAGPSPSSGPARPGLVNAENLFSPR